MTTATAQIERINLRRRRAESLAHGVLSILRDHLPRKCEQDAFNKLLDEKLGVEVLTDADRSQHGLPPRGPDGWTAEELHALERRRLELMTRPIIVEMPR